MSSLEVWTERYKRGSARNIDLLVINGGSQADDFLEWLRKNDREALYRFERIFERECNGELSNKKMFHAVKGKGAKGAYEFKAKGRKTWRIYCFRRDNSWVLTHGGEKPKDKKVVEEGKKCIERKRLLEEYGND